MQLNDTGIGWTDATCNPVRGCTKASEGCKNCYAEALTMRMDWGSDEPWTAENAESVIELIPDRLRGPQPTPDDPKWVFMDSMSDLFNPFVPADYRGDVFGACADHPESCFQILTKWGPEVDADPIPLPRNVMLGVTVESDRRKYRLDWLRERDARVKFVSFEPLVERVVRPDLSGIDWAIIGGESHKQADERRDMDPEWARELIASCREQGVAVYFKQHSGLYPEQDDRIAVDGGEKRAIKEFPETPSGVVNAPEEYR